MEDADPPSRALPLCPVCVPWRSVRICALRQESAHSSVVYSCPNLETTSMSISGRMDK